MKSLLLTAVVLVNGALSIPPGGPSDPTADVQTLLAHLGQDWLSPHFVTSSFAAAQITSETHPSVGFSGGEISGIPVAVSPYVLPGLIALVDAASVAIGEGDAEVRIARDATVEMENQPTSDVVTPTGTSQVNLWQADAIGILAEKTVNWRLMRPDAAIYIEDASWAVSSVAT